MCYSVSIIGTGKVAGQLADGLKKQGISIHQICGRQERKAKKLAQKVQAEGITEYQHLRNTADVYIIAVSDSAIKEVQELLPQEIRDHKIVVHTSGFTSVDILDSIRHRGIFYPLNSFAEDSPVDFMKTPIFIDSNFPEDLRILRNIAGAISKNVEQADDKKRETLHIAAVIVSNFTIGLKGMGEELMAAIDLPMEHLGPLMEKTYENALKGRAAAMITGPAARRDREVIDKHLRKLEKFPDIKEVYALISEYIIKKL